MDLKAELARERRARLAAERLLKLRQEELAQANKVLGEHAIALSEQVIKKRVEAEQLRDQTVDAQEKLELARGEVDIAKRRLWSSIETIEDGFSVFDNDGQLVIANSAFLSAFDGIEDVRPGISYPEILELLTSEGIVDTGDLSRRDWRRMMARRWAKDRPEPMTVRLWNGTYIRLTDQRGEDGDTVSLALNITESVRYQQRIKAASERAKAASRAKSAFLARMSHELRTPMNGVVGMADLLLEDDLNEEQKLYVETIRSSGEALLDLINNILHFSKLEAQREELHPEPFDLRRLMTEIMQLFRPALAARPVDMRLNLAEDIAPAFNADSGRLRQILTNLIGNALKFTDEGLVTVSVERVVPEAEGGANIQFRVQDTGIGIPSDQINHIFGEFTQVQDEKNRKFEGTGLGLAISRQLVELMGGTIRVESVLGEGSCFTVDLPLQPSDALPDKVISAADPATSAVLDTKDAEVSNEGPRRMRILAAEDNKTNRLVFEKMLKPLDIDLDFAENGAVAVFKWKELKPDLVFMDISMPNVDGIEATRMIRDEEARLKLPKTPIIALTAHSVTGDREEILSKGLDFYMTKPLRKAEIFEQIRLHRPESCRPVEQGGPRDAEPAILDLSETEPSALAPAGPPDPGSTEAARAIWNGLNREGTGPKSIAAARVSADAGPLPTRMQMTGF